MKLNLNKAVVFLFIGLILSSSILHADETKKPKFYLGTGMSFPASPLEFSQFYSPAKIIEIGVGTKLSSHFELRLKVSHQSIHLEDLFKAYLVMDYGNTWMLNTYKPKITDREHFVAFYLGMVELKYAITQTRFSPYIVIGAGTSVIRRLYGVFTDEWKNIYHFETPVNAYFAYSTGIGFDFQVNKKLSIYMEANLTNCFDTKDNFLINQSPPYKHPKLFPVKAGIAFYL
jgi:opacity protein-like surface antigen